MKRQRQWWGWAVVVAGLAIMVQTQGRMKAQDNDAQSADQDPPGRVARLNFMQGSVSFQPGGENDWVDGVLNRPLVTGDNLWADENSRAEVHIGSTALYLGPKTGITLLDVSDVATQIRLAQGALIVRVRHVDDEDSYEIDTPNIAFVVRQPGQYQIDVDADGNRTDVTVWHGRGQVTGGGDSRMMMANQHAAFTSTTNNTATDAGTGAGTNHVDYEPGQVPEQSGFDNWAQGRDQIEDGSDSASYVSRDMTGYEDLGQYGSWSNVAGYGMVWQPAGLVAGWAPYRFGHWTWVGPWGWTWVADEPWGFAPFHYGRWAFAGSGWVWVPGPNVARPVYAPALVAWVGGGPGFHWSGGVGVGWLPLAPGEVFVPGYRVSREYVNKVNISNTAVNVTRIGNVYDSVVTNRGVNDITYANRNVNGGVTVVSHAAFVNARPVARNAVPVPARELAVVPVSHALAVEPARNSVLGGGAPVANKPPAAAMSRPVVAVRTHVAMPGSFNQRQAIAGSNLAKPKPVVWEEQGSPEAEKSARQEPEKRNPKSPGSRAVQQGVPQAQSHSVAKAAAPVQEKNPQQKEQEQKNGSAQQQKPASSPPQRQQNTRPPAPKVESAPKK
ncbi:MAG: DUF6600 domain-containing protein [Candidatus Sulfotelmatobacter sp.]|jgi:uncharacterized protein DUF6600/FecR-like protein